MRLTETSLDGTTTNTYDNLGRLTGTTYPGSTPAETFGYDAVGNRTTRVSSGVTTTSVYNDANELATVTTSGSTATYNYDLNGNRTSVVTPPTADATAPTVPASPNASASAADQVTVTWTASTDDRGVTGYLVYRGGTLVGLVSGSVTTFTDRTTAPVVAYSYTIAAIDAAGNTSAQSSAANVTTPATGPTVVATDRYTRTVSGSWGTADAGGAWSNTDSTFSVNGTQGLIALTGSATKNAYLASASGSNTESLVQVRLDQIATGSATTDGFYLRRQDSNNWYSVNAVFNTDSSVNLTFVRDASGTTTTIGTATVSGVTHSTSAWYWIRARLSGTTATTASVRLWTAGTNEPTTWTLSSTDNSTPTNLRGSGSTGVYLNTGRALNAYYDDLTERPIDSTAPTTPTALTGTPVAAGRIDLSWTASTDTVGVAGYNVYRDSTKVNTVPVGSTSYSDTGLTAGANHTYTVSALDAAGNESAQSNTYTGAAASGAVTTTYTYDAENRLTQLQTGSTVLGTYSYDGAGDRISKTVGTATTAYTLDLASGLPQVLAETTGSATTSYAYAGGPLEIDQAGTTYWYLTDTLGSVRLLTDSTGATPATYAYSAFGSTRASTGSITNEVRFTGERTDTESGLEFLRARTYDPATGTFLERDTWGIAPTNSQSIDAYLYTANDPANSTDPSGHMRGNRDDGHIGQAGPSAYTVTSGSGAVQGPPAPPPTPTVTKPSSQPASGCSWLPWESGNCEGQAAGGVGNLWAQGPGSFINTNSKAIIVVVVIAGSVAVCEYGSEICASLILAAIDGGGTVCAAEEAACQELVAGGETAASAVPYSASDPAIQTVINNLYKHFGQPGTMGDGSTMAAYVTDGSHGQVLDEQISALEKAVGSGRLDSTDELTAFQLLKMIKDTKNGIYP